MIQAIPSQLAETTVAASAWNPGGYDPKRSWDAALAALGGSGSGALRTFADNNLSSALGPTESPTSPGSRRSRRSSPRTATSCGTLAAGFDKLAAATPIMPSAACPAGFSTRGRAVAGQVH